MSYGDGWKLCQAALHGKAPQLRSQEELQTNQFDSFTGMAWAHSNNFLETLCFLASAITPPTEHIQMNLGPVDYFLRS